MKKILAIAIAAVLTVALCVSAAAIHNPDDTTKVWFDRENLNISWDTVYIDGQSQMDLGWGGDGSAHEKVEANPITVGSAETITIRGWAGIKEGKAVEFGYRLNEGEPVFNADFAKPTEDAVINAGGDSRFEIVVPVKGLTAPTLITAVAKGEDGAVCDFIEFSVNGQYTGGGSSDPQPVAEKDPDTWLCQAGDQAATTGWWMHPFTDHEWEFTAKFTTPNAFDGFIALFFANPEGAKVQINLLDEAGAVLDSQEFTQAGDGSPTIKFSKAFAAGTYTLQIKSTDTGAHFVVGSAHAGDVAVEVGGNCNTNDNTLDAPVIVLTGAVASGASEPSNPGTADASVIAIAAVACVALAGVVIAKKVR